MGSHCIVVNVPTADPKACFIVMPFGPEFNEIYAVVRDAAALAGLTPSRTDENGTIDFVHDIISMPRSARLIVAVCTPITRMGDKDVPNPNVMYELGIAHALGKPTIILTTDPASLPADIGTKYAISYSPLMVRDNGKREDLKYQIKSRMDDVLNRVGKDGIVDPEWGAHGIASVSPRHSMCVNPIFFDSFSKIITFTEGVQRYFNPVASSTSQLRIHIDRIVGGDDDDFVFEEFSRVWARYIPDAMAAINFINRQSTKYAEVDAALAKVRELAGNDPEALDRSNKAGEYYSHLKAGLKKYDELHNEIQQKTFPDGHSFGDRLKDYDFADQLQPKIQNIATRTSAFLGQSHRIMADLIMIA